MTTVAAGFDRALSVGIVADDLTGANDSAVQFARRGWRTALALADGPVAAVQPNSVLALVSDSRAQKPETARASTAGCVSKLCAAGTDRLFIKIDSTMRGSVSDQIHGALDAWSARYPGAFAVVCPAYPKMGRAVANGRLLVDGRGVETTAIGRDPVTPVVTNDMSLLLPGSAHLAVGENGAAGLTADIEALVASGTRVVVVDASTTVELEAIADAAGTLGPACVPVGAAGLAVEMSSIWANVSTSFEPREPADARIARVLVVMSSLHDVSRLQFRQLVASMPAENIRVFEPPLGVVLRADGIGSPTSDWIASKLALEADLPRVVVVSSSDARPDPSHDRPERESAAVMIASSLALVAEAVFDHAQVDALVLVGGEGARAVLDRFGARLIQVVDAIREGVPIGSIDGGKSHGLTVVTKAGGFGAAESLAEVVAELLSVEPVTRDLLNTEQGENR
jgi:uncharacterized protein YgbK (DUF1537 family)